MPDPSAPRSSNPTTPLQEVAWPQLGEDVIDRLRQAGTESDYAEGEVLFDIGEDACDFMFLTAGCVDIVDRLEERTVVTVEAGGFIGELGMLMGGKTFLAAVASTAGRAVHVPLAKLRELIANVPEVADPIVGAFAARRRMLIENGDGAITIVGRDDDRDALRIREFASRNGLPHTFVDRADQAAMADLRQSCEIPAEGAAVVVPSGEVMHRPDACEVARVIGLDLGLDAEEVFDLAIVGAGPGGLAAAVYGASEGLSTIIIEDTAIGGQAGTSSRIENYLGFPQGISGAELAYRAQVQAIKFGARLVAPRRATHLQRADDAWRLSLEQDESVRARAVVLANGVQYRRLKVPGLEEFEGAGVYYAATELEARFCRGTDAVIVGGGNSAGQAAMFLSRHARCTYVVVRSGGLADTMSAYLSDRIEADERIALVTHTELARLEGEGHLERVVVRDKSAGTERTLDCRALFIMIGAEPNTGWLADTLALDEGGFVLTGHEVGATGMATSAEGVFAVGDIRSGSVKRVASAVGEGSVVVSAVHEYLRRSADSEAVEPESVVDAA